MILNPQIMFKGPINPKLKLEMKQWTIQKKKKRWNNEGKLRKIQLII